MHRSHLRWKSPLASAWIRSVITANKHTHNQLWILHSVLATGSFRRGQVLPYYLERFPVSGITASSWDSGQSKLHTEHIPLPRKTPLWWPKRGPSLCPLPAKVFHRQKSAGPLGSATYPHAAFPIKQDSCVNPVSPGRWINTFTARNCKTIAVSCCMCVSSRHKTTLKLETDDLFMYVWMFV